MRSTPIIDIIRKYGLSSRRLSPRAHIKYEDAIKKITEFESASLKIVDVIDNGLFPSKSVSCRCQMPGCNHRIRYEYVLENKISKDRVVAGSTCVWPALGFSELQVKEFKGLETVLKEHHALVEWTNEHPDLVDKLNRLKNEGFNQFRPFWQEIEISRLTDKDTEYLKTIDVDELIQKREEEKAKRARRTAEIRRAAQMSIAEKAKMETEYKRVLAGLDTLVKAYPDNSFYASLLRQSEKRKLSPEQVKYVKIGCNDHWYKTAIQGTKKDIMGQVEGIIRPIMDANNLAWTAQTNNSFIEKMNEIVSTMDEVVKKAWALMKVKHRWVTY